MKIEFEWHTFGDGEWWFDLGISYQTTEYYPYYPEKKHVFTIALALASIYIRW